MVWQYHTEKFKTGFKTFSGVTFDHEAMNRRLNQLGESGWELVNITGVEKSSTGTAYVVAVLKRPQS